MPEATTKMVLAAAVFSLLFAISTGASWMLINIFKDGKDVKYWKRIK